MAGIVSAGDLGGALGDLLRVGRRVADVLTERVVAVTPQTTIREAANLMRGHAIDCLPVLVAGKVTGIVTSLDLLELLGRGALRPSPRSERAILKDRGRAPRALAVAKRVSPTGASGANRSGARRR